MNKSRKNPIIIDTDPGIDDAVALAIALLNNELPVDLLTTVAGNVNVEHTSNNALKLVEFYKSEVPVAKGAAEPLVNKLIDASEIHGETGLAGYAFPEIKKDFHEKNAVEAMKDQILSNKEKTRLIALGPLTNIALLIKSYPEVKGKIKEIIFMGGSLSGGNITSAAEFNLYNDPHAAEIVLHSDLDLVMIGLDVTMRALISKKEIKQIRERGELGEMLYSLFSHYRSGTMEEGLVMHDACTLAYLLAPNLFETKDLHLEMVLDGPAIGATVTKFLDPEYQRKTVRVCLGIKEEQFREWIRDELLKATDRLCKMSR